MNPDYFVKRGDNSPVIGGILRDAAKAPVNLTGATVMFFMTKRGASTPTVIGEVDLAGDPTTGGVSYSWQEGDTDEIGHYNAEFEVTYAGGEKQTFPNYGYIHVHIAQDLSDEVSA